VPVAALINLIHLLPLPALLRKEEEERERMLSMLDG